MRRDWGWAEDITYLAHIICVQGGRAEGERKGEGKNLK